MLKEVEAPHHLGNIVERKGQFREWLVADQAHDEILGLARQGNLQALSVYLNRHLIPHGAHVKLKQKDDALHILIVVMRDTENQGLLTVAQNLLLRLSPAGIQTVKIYTQVLGQNQATLKQKFSIPSAAARSALDRSTVDRPSVDRPTVDRATVDRPIGGAKSTYASSPSGGYPSTRAGHQPLHPKASYPVSQPTAYSPKYPASEATPSHTTPQRYSVAEFLSQATDIKDLQILQRHPFVTGACPKCGHSFKNSATPPKYWDCPKCGWKDDLSSAIPRNKIHAGSAQTSLTESKRLGDYLVEAGLLTDSQIEVALTDQLTTGLRFGEVLVRRGWVKEETIEYLMQKVILPERAGLDQNLSSILASSRNLLRTILQEPSESPLPPAGSLSTRFDGAVAASEARDSAPALPSPAKLPNERETLILPDLDMSEYLKDA